MLIKLCLIEYGGDLFAFSGYLAIALATLPLAATGGLFGFRPPLLKVFKLLFHLKAFWYKNNPFRHTRSVLQMSEAAKSVWRSAATCWHLAAAMFIGTSVGNLLCMVTPWTPTISGNTPRFPGLNSDTVTLSHEIVISSSGSHSSTSSSMMTSPPSAISRLEHRVSIFTFLVNHGAFFGGLPLTHCAFN
jgi:hypothetical protein